MKPSIPKGTRDFSPTEVAQRNYIFNTIKASFENFGFQPIETPSFENSSTLMGKYGEEGDRLIFKILNSGDYFMNIRRIKVKTILDSNTFFKFFMTFIKEDMSSYDEILDVLLIKYYPHDVKRESIKKYMLTVKQELIGELSLIDGQDKIQEENLLRAFFLSFNNYFLLDSEKSTKLISEKALRYDLTVPFARYVVQHQNDISFPFKRYQIQPVWRADRPQKGRFREFYQCDADVVGSKSLVQEVEFVQLYDDVFSKLKLSGVTIKMNNRKILSGIAEVIGAADKLIDFTVALDKLDKIGVEGVTNEMLSKGITQEAIDKVQPLFNFSGSNSEKLNQLKGMLETSDEGLGGVKELQFVVDAISELGLQSASLEIDVTLARGLNYYTGAIFEVSAPEGVKMGSIGGGGRYDDLTGIFGLKDVSGVGISFGLDRIYLVLEELNLFESVELPKPKVLFLNFDEQQQLSSLKAINILRRENIKCEIFPDVALSNKQQKKQWKYVSNRSIEFVVTKVEGKAFTLKNMNTGNLNECSLSELIKTLN
ncbi:MAG: histidine--tRNA ligase [Flavobacteriaceae bacterium]